MSTQKQIILLQVIRPDGTQSYDIHKSEFVLGRGDTSEVPIKDNGISREHVLIRLHDNLIQIKDLNSSNGTFVGDSKVAPLAMTPVFANDTISFGNSAVKIKLKVVEISEQVAQEVAVAIKKDEPAEVIVDLSAFPKTPDDFKINFKNVGLQLPKTESVSDKSKDIIKQAEFIKHSIIKSAEVYKAKTINEANLQIKKAKDEAYADYQLHIDRLLEDTKKQLSEMKTETEIMLDEKRLQAGDEIQNLWKEHNALIAEDKAKQLEILEKENFLKLELSSEKLKSEMFAERNKLLTQAENEVLQQRRLLQIKYENENAEHVSRNKMYTDELKKVQTSIADCETSLKLLTAQKDDAEVEYSKISSQLKQETESLEFVNNALAEKSENHKKIESDLARFGEHRNNWQAEKEVAVQQLKELNHQFSLLSEKKQKVEEQITALHQTLEDTNRQVKAKVEAEYRILKEIEVKKFADYKANELKELQSIRDSHAAGIKKFSVDLSLEIATKLEMLFKKNDTAGMDFDQTFELINSVIQVKSAVTTGSESSHADQIDNWKQRNRKETFMRLSTGFVAGLIAVSASTAIYKRLNTDPVQEELARMNIQRKQREIENQFVPEKVNKYFNSYVESTLYTQNFTEVYLDEDIHQEWVKFASKHFLRQWKVEEEKVIQVISNSKALVQNVNEAKATLKKSRITADLAKLKAQEEDSVKGQSRILGTMVKYEAYKKLEREFFTQKLQRRIPAQQ